MSPEIARPLPARNENSRRRQRKPALVAAATIVLLSLLCLAGIDGPLATTLATGPTLLNGSAPGNPEPPAPP